MDNHSSSSPSSIPIHSSSLSSLPSSMSVQDRDMAEDNPPDPNDPHSPPDVVSPEQSPPIHTSPLDSPIPPGATSVRATRDNSDDTQIPVTAPFNHIRSLPAARPPSFHRYSQEPRPPPGDPTELWSSTSLTHILHDSTTIDINTTNNIDNPETTTTAATGPAPTLPAQQPLRIPPLSLGTLSNFHPQSNGHFLSSADEPPPYSPTHTILPHYFSLDPIPVRSYLIKDSTSLPFLFDFWLVSATHSTPQPVTASLTASMASLPVTSSAPSPSRPHSPTQQLQERGLVPQQHQNELKYCIIRPVHTDRTAFPITNASATNAYFIPALALVAANYPSRWIWWGTEALQMVVFGRNLKNIIMEWRWKHGRTRIGGPIVHRLVGCSFRVTPERRYCWKQGTGKKRTPAAVAAAARRANRAAAGQSRGVGSGQLLPGGTTAGVRGGGGNWFGSFFSRSSSPSSTLPYGASSDIPLNQVVTAPRASSEQDTTAIPPQEGRIPDVAAVDDDVDDDEELGCYHCREESPSGITGRIVAVYKPGRPANRARDRPATSRKLEIFTEVGERCETAMMLMCTRLEDLFLSIPDEKKGPFVSSNLRQGGTTDDDAQLDGAVAEGEEGQPEENGETGVLADDSVRSTVSSISLKQRIKGTKASWRARLKWLVAAVLVAVVLVLVLKPKFRH